MAHLGDESGHFSGVLDALRRLDAARHVDAPRTHGADRACDIALVKPAGEDQRSRPLARSERPVEALADAAVFRHVAVEQPCRGAHIGLQVRKRIDPWAYPARLDERQAELRAEFRRLIAVEL